MIYTSTPVVFEIIEESGDIAAKVSCFDEGAANVEILKLHNRHSFDALVPHIQVALSAMKLEGDK